MKALPGVLHHFAALRKWIALAQALRLILALWFRETGHS